jgi:hypothetical protein
LLLRGGVVDRERFSEHFAFDFANGAFHPRVVVRIARPAHAAQQPMRRQERTRFSAGVLRTPIRVNKQPVGRPTMRHGHLERGHHQFAAQVIGHGPAHDAPTPQVHDQSQIQPALRRRHVSQVAHPDLVGATGHPCLSQTIGRDGLIVITVGSAWHEALSHLRLQTVALHEPRNTVLAARMAQRLELSGQARTAVGALRSLMQLRHRGEQSRVGLRPGRGRPRAPSVIARAAHLQDPAQQAQRIFLLHDLNALIESAHVVETMPKVFFRMSRCWRN